MPTLPSVSVDHDALLRARGPLSAIGDLAARLVRGIRRALHPDEAPVEILAVDPRRRRILSRELRAGLCQLRRALDEPVPGHVAVVVQRTIRGDHELVGSCCAGERPDGSRFALIRLALQVGDYHLTPDDLLSVLAEQYIELALQQYGPSVRFPIELDRATASEAGALRNLRPDPLGPRPNGHAVAPRERAA